MFTGLAPFRAKAGPGAPMELLLPGTMRGSRATSAVAVEGTSAAQFKAGLAELSKLAQVISAGTQERMISTTPQHHRVMAVALDLRKLTQETDAAGPACKAARGTYV